MAADVHFQVPGPDGNYGYGGKCFPNNLEIFKKFSNDANFFASTIEILNRKYRGKEWVRQYQPPYFLYTL